MLITPWTLQLNASAKAIPRRVSYRTNPELSNNALCAPPGSPKTLGRTRSELRPSWKSQEQSCKSVAEPVQLNWRGKQAEIGTTMPSVYGRIIEVSPVARRIIHRGG
jgi:hypothetical protein